MVSATQAVTIIPNSEIYAGAAIVDRKLTTAETDYALVRLDRLPGRRLYPHP